MPNALAFASDIVDNLLNEKSIILNCSKGFPWYSHLAMNIKESVKRQNSSKRFEHVSDESDPGAYLLREFCKPGKRADYRLFTDIGSGRASARCRLETDSART